MLQSQGLQIAAATAGRALTPEQKRFNQLLGHIEAARARLAGWQEQVPIFRQAYQQRIVPLEQEVGQAERRWLAALDALSTAPKWSRTERQTMSQLICRLAGEILESQEEPDAELKALYDRHSDLSFDEEQGESALMMKEMAQFVTGLDLGSEEGLVTEEDVLRRMQEKMAEARESAEGEGSVPPWAQPRRKKATAGNKRKQKEAEEAQLTLREVFRKLASALHPDRETDPAQREAKTALMQRVNQAYAANDLLTLLALQLEIEQVDAAHIAGASAKRLKHYNKLLAEQLAELKQETARQEMAFEMEFFVDGPPSGSPAKLGAVLDRCAKELRDELADLERSIRMLADKPATKRWLKVKKRELADDGFDDFDDEIPF